MSGLPASLLFWGERRSRWVLAATVLGSALTFIDMTVVPVAVPAVGAEFGLGSVGMTWVANAYTLGLAAFVLLGGSLGDRYGRRRIFLAGVVCFSLSSTACALAPGPGVLIALRAVQGIGAALLAPTSIAVLEASFAPRDRARAIGAWTGLTAVATAAGPFVGGWLVQTAGWRWVFLVNLPVALAVVLISRRHVPESRDPAACLRLDVPGAVLLVAALGALAHGLTAWAGSRPADPAVAGPLLAGAVLLVLFLRQERRATSPLLPLEVFRERLFVGSNLVTFVVYAPMGATFFLLPVVLQVGAGFSPLAAGAAVMPIALLLTAFSASVGRWVGRSGPRVPVIAGCLLAALGLALLTGVRTGADYVLEVLLPVSVFGAGLTLYVTPLTSAALAALPDARAGLASGVNNAVSRTAGLLAVAAVPLVGGLGGGGLADPERALEGFAAVMWAGAALLAVGGVLSAALICPDPVD
ncbi:MFS transporter [Kocuria sp. M1R5S2]|uniref:MFS transporter n=1 Tax=Kocuria rhizosphaerae TaxID=3376285 RepID=UPI0037B6FEF1